MQTPGSAAKKPTARARNRQDAAAAPATDRHSASDRQVLREHGLSADILDIFDFRYYFYANPRVQQDLDKPDQHRCLTHFCMHGVDGVRPFNEAFVFDAEFYNETYLGWQVGPSNAYWHWINVGIQNDWHSNRENWLKEKIGCDAKTFAGFDFEVCKEFYYGNEINERWTDLFTCFIEKDIFSPGPHLPITKDAADFFVAVADRFAVGGKDDEAASIYEHVLWSVPDHRHALLNYADCLRRKRLFLHAQTTYGMLERQDDSIWCLLNQAACCEELGDSRMALTQLRTGMDRFPGEPRFQSQFHTLADQFVTGEWRMAVAIGELGRYGEAQRRLQQACDCLSSMITAKEQLSPRGPIRSVAIVGHRGLPQCYFYRIEQKIEHLRAAGCDAVFYDFQDSLPKFLTEIYKFQAVIFNRVPAFAPVLQAIHKSKELGIITFYDVDDLIFSNEDNYPGTFESFFDLITIEDYVGLKLGVPLFRCAISQCDYGIASTPALAGEMAKLLPSVQAAR
jgi:hypothetical protein